MPKNPKSALLQFLKSVHKNFYVDFYIKFVADIKTASEFVKLIQRLLLAGGSRLHKWLFTSQDVLKTIPESEHVGSTKKISAI